ncbi:MAG: glycosyltransferase 87 family protein [Candidatus Hermodarchaeota archaeon]
MKLKSYIAYFKKILKVFWGYKSFKAAFYIQIGFIITSIILTLTFLRDTNDFLVFYRSAEVFLNNFQELYNPVEYGSAWEYRYFPLSPLVFIPFYILGFDVGFITFTIFNFIVNLLICIILFRIINMLKTNQTEKDKIDIIYYISVYLIGVPQLVNYFLGQINLYVTFLTLLALYIFLKYESIKWDFIGSIILGTSVILKPITVLLIPFLILISINLKKRKINFLIKRSVLRLFSAMIPIFFNVLVFIIYSNLWNGFMEVNFTGSNPTDVSFSFSLTKLIMNFFVFYNINFNQTLIFFIVLIIFGLLGFFIYVFRRNTKNSILIGFIFGILITYISYFEVWEHHLLTLIPFVIIFLFILPNNSNILKRFIIPSFYVYNFLHLAFLLIFVLTYNFFPYNFGVTIFLILNFYGIIKYCISKNRKKSDE